MTPQPRTSTPSIDRRSELWAHYGRDHGADLRLEIFDAYLPFARAIARRHFLDRSSDIELADLEQLASAGLLEAIDRFDPRRGVPFESFAAPRVAGSVVDGLAHLSERREQLAFNRRVEKERLRSLAIAAPAGRMSAAEAMAALAELAIGTALSFMLEETGLVADDATPDHRPNAYESAAWKDLVSRLATEVGSLEGREQAIIRKHYHDGLTFEMIGTLLGLSTGRISQIHRAALSRLRKRLLAARQFSLMR
ncbi:sigma-70 family RNA polymerase sigma factor [Sphingomonas sanxanigenens]|uniref:RNA polymerase sigma-70 domain-containing protein n=1 Tax=Sphingomonas sanxanigenens DSM 19645 = NX02 TaxID=1123269 RepID=W0ACM0_9SPHN|nr:sigma-70 family RNA polymerase sigma factor [Sphingomonas sanxanigenens]AHE55639.1 hypothetical protein NX02_19900 [Sphingomonas sanxanigenens DSM 19645 = NX02]